MDEWYPRWAAHPPGISVDGWTGFRIDHDRDYWCPVRTESMRLYLRRRGIVVPFLDAAFWSALLPGVWGLRRIPPYLQRRRALRASLCPACGYDLRATPNRCPECGTAVGGGGVKRSRVRAPRGRLLLE